MISAKTTLFVLLILSADASAIGLGVNPAKLEFEGDSGQLLTKTLYVINSDDDKIGYSVYADDNLPYLTLTPTEFQLNPGELQTVNVSVYSLETIEYMTRISVVSEASSSRLGIAAGVKIPVNVVVKHAKNSVSSQDTSTPPEFIGNVIAYASGGSMLAALAAILSLGVFAAATHAKSKRGKKPDFPNERKQKGLKHI